MAGVVVRVARGNACETTMGPTPHPTGPSTAAKRASPPHRVAGSWVEIAELDLFVVRDGARRGAVHVSAFCGWWFAACRVSVELERFLLARGTGYRYRAVSTHTMCHVICIRRHSRLRDSEG
eukprot:6629011-Prymnesium_polylepis.1